MKTAVGAFHVSPKGLYRLGGVRQAESICPECKAVRGVEGKPATKKGRGSVVVAFRVTEATPAHQKGRIIEKYREMMEENGGGAIVFHEMRYIDGTPDKTDKSWLPEALDEFISWAKGAGYVFALYGEE